MKAVRYRVHSYIPQYLGNDAAELRSVLGEGQQVADGTADGVNAVRWVNLFDQELRGRSNVHIFISDPEMQFTLSVAVAFECCLSVFKEVIFF